MASKKSASPAKAAQTKAKVAVPLAKKVAKPAASAPSKAAKKVAPVAVAAPSRRPGLEFIGTFPMRKNPNEKKTDVKKQAIGPVFPKGDYKVGTRATSLSGVLYDEFNGIFLGKHSGDTIKVEKIESQIDLDPASIFAKVGRAFNIYTRELDDALLSKRIDVAVSNMKDIPLELPPGLVLAAALRREDSRDAMVTRATYGAIQELPTKARVGTASKRRIMQIRHLRPDIEIVQVFGDLNTRLEKLESENLDAVIVAWATLRRQNVSPRYYVALQPEMMIPAASQGTIGVVCRAEDKDLIAKLRYIEDSEASWSARCERAFLQKLGGSRDVPVGVFAHRKGTQDPWILDSVIGDARTGEVLKHREIGTSRCKPESLADKAFMGILAKGARKFLPF